MPALDLGQMVVDNYSLVSFCLDAGIFTNFKLSDNIPSTVVVNWRIWIVTCQKLAYQRFKHFVLEYLEVVKRHWGHMEAQRVDNLDHLR
jgi:hypothetical protein